MSRMHPFIRPETMVMPNLYKLTTDNADRLATIQFLCGEVSSLGIDDEAIENLTAWGVHATLAIEGNPLSRTDVLSIVRNENRHITYDPWQTQVKNMLNALGVSRDFQDREITIGMLNRYHDLLMQNTGFSTKDYVEIGKLRTLNVRVGNYVCPDHSSVSAMMEHFVKWLNDPVDKTQWITKSIVAHAWFVLIHPYGDGNGRMTRLLEFNCLRNAGVPEIYAHGLSEFYHYNRYDYYDQLGNVSSKSDDGEYEDGMALDEFVRWAIDGLLEGIRDRKAYITHEVVH